MHNHKTGLNSIVDPDKDNNLPNLTVTFKEGESMDDWEATQEEKPKEISLETFDQYRITKEKNIPQPEPTITIGGGAFASPGNISAISAAAKAGKTAFTGAIIAGAISNDGIIDGFTDLEVLPNTTGKAVIHFDTEQSEADQQYFVKTIMKRANIESTPDYYRSYNIRQLALSDYKEVTNSICELCSLAYNGVHMIIIDGGADYIASVNDEEQATLILQYFVHLSILFNCPVIIVVHLNPGSEKERGHFGSTLQRKCYGLLTIKKDGDVSTAEPKLMRKAGNGEMPLVHFTYSKDKGYHIQIDAPNKMEERAKKDFEKVKVVAETVFNPPTALTHKNAITAIMKHLQKGETTAKNFMKNMVAWELVSKGVDSFYRLNLPNKGQGSERVNLGQD